MMKHLVGRPLRVIRSGCSRTTDAVHGQDLAQYSHVGTTAQHPPQQDLLLALSFCRAVYGLTFRKGRSGMLRRKNETRPLAAC
jgi:hypothetical protein